MPYRDKMNGGRRGSLTCGKASDWAQTAPSWPRMAAAVRRWLSMSQSRWSSTYACHDMPPPPSGFPGPVCVGPLDLGLAVAAAASSSRSSALLMRAQQPQLADAAPSTSSPRLASAQCGHRCSLTHGGAKKQAFLVFNCFSPPGFAS